MDLNESFTRYLRRGWKPDQSRGQLDNDAKAKEMRFGLLSVHEVEVTQKIHTRVGYADSAEEAAATIVTARSHQTLSGSKGSDRGSDRSFSPPRRIRARPPTITINLEDEDFQRVNQSKGVPLNPEPAPWGQTKETNPVTRPISQEQLVAEVKGIYSGLVMVESKSPVVESATNALRDYERAAHSAKEVPARQTPASSSATYSSVSSSQLEISGELNGVAVDACADTGSSFNTISRALAEELGLKAKPGTGGYLPLPSGKRISSPGLVHGTFKFSGEAGEHALTCVVLPDTKHRLLLGSKFLRITQTMTKYAHRITKKLSNMLSLKLLGGEQDLLSGYLNNTQCMVVPDTGSDIMAMSPGYARRLGLKIHRESRHKRKLQFIDGSRGRTSGLVKNVQWRFRESDAPIKCDFYILDNLPVNAIVSNTFLDRFDVFSTYEDLIEEHGPEEDEAGIYGISLIEKYREEIRSLEDQYTEDITSANPFTPEMVDRERARRDEIRDRINLIPKSQRESDKFKEKERQRKWTRLKKEHEANKKPQLTSSFRQ